MSAQPVDFEGLGHEWVAAATVVNGRPDAVLAVARDAAERLPEDVRREAEESFKRGANREAGFHHEASFRGPFA